ncbi:MAG: bifunctional folylpolyglutamate synthase/dihydrofolate synthase, partial [Actinobacteria bacterium]|nr:bifunctional folylpolyglutamate synthase/dihydrofolate synthase [Actinomycetota bacterium]
MTHISPEDQSRIDAIEQALLARWPETRIEPTLERIAALVDMLGSPQLSYPTIHIGGTNGKTTTSRMIDSLLFEMGLRTGRFTSPHLESYLERIAINGEPIAAKDLIFSFNDISAYLDLMDEKFEHPISFFEAITALAFAAFAEHPIDVGVIEVGMGGQWDATNVVKADVSVIMPIGLDHTEYLGETLTEIAQTKAGIIKEGGYVVLAQQEPECAVELLKQAALVGADVAREGVEYSVLTRSIAVGGLVAVEVFFGDQDLDIEAVRAGFANVKSPGRCEVLHRDPTIIVDAAHNPHGASAIADTIQSDFTFDEVIGIFAPMGDKDVRGILLELEQVMDSVIVTANSSPRSMKVSELEKMAVEIFGSDRVFAAPTVTEAIDKAVKDCIRPLSEDTIGILITGSVVTVGEARAIVRKKFA